jgi:hypothetical protein
LIIFESHQIIGPAPYPPVLLQVHTKRVLKRGYEDKAKETKVLGHFKAAKVAATAALAVGAVAGTAGPALAVGAPGNCPSGVVCIYINSNYSSPNPPGEFSGDNSNWATDFTPANFWNNSVSSAYNNLAAAHQVALFVNPGGFYNQSKNVNFSFCLNYQANTADTQNFANVHITVMTNFNDAASSDVVYQGSSSWCGWVQ